MLHQVADALERKPRIDGDELLLTYIRIADSLPLNLRQCGGEACVAVPELRIEVDNVGVWFACFSFNTVNALHGYDAP